MDHKKEAKKFIWKFVKLEIPNFIQILGLISILSYLIKNPLLIGLFAGPIIIVFQTYMSEKFHDSLLLKAAKISSSHSLKEAKAFIDESGKVYKWTIHISGFIISLIIVSALIIFKSNLNSC